MHRVGNKALNNSDDCLFPCLLWDSDPEKGISFISLMSVSEQPPSYNHSFHFYRDCKECCSVVTGRTVFPFLFRAAILLKSLNILSLSFSSSLSLVCEENLQDYINHFYHFHRSHMK